MRSNLLPYKPSCLIVEDQALIGMSLEAYLQDAGYEVVVPFGTVQQGSASLSVATPTCAILDYKLKDGLCLGLASELQKRAIPFVIYSGLPRAHVPSTMLQAAPWLEKPTGRVEMLRVLAELLSEAPEPAKAQRYGMEVFQDQKC